MKKSITTTLAFCMAALTMAQPKTVYLNSKTITCNPYGVKKECLQYKNNQADTAWNVYNGTIRGFTYNPGFFYTLQVQQLKSNRPDWKLVKVVNKTKSVEQQLPGDSVVSISKPPAALVGRWTYTRLLSDEGEVKFSKEFLQFDARDLKVTGRASCNGFFGNYIVDSAKGENAIQFQALGHTMMACENLATENKLLKAMELVDNWTVSGNKLYLKVADKTIIELTKAANGKI